MPRTPGAREIPPITRARICELHSIGWTYKQIHDRYPDFHYTTNRNTIKKEALRHNQQSIHRPGRQKKLSPQQEADLKRRTEENTHIKMHELLEDVQNSASKRTVRRLFQNMHKKKWIQRDRPELQPYHAEKRLEWARKYAHFTPMDWRRVIWTDECSVERGLGLGQYGHGIHLRSSFKSMIFMLSVQGRESSRCFGEALPTIGGQG